MARGIQEGNGAAVDVHGVSADGLGNAAGLAGGNVCVPDIVQQRGLAVVNVTHHHHNGCPGDQIFFLVLAVINQTVFHGDNDFFFHLAAHFHGHQSGGIVVNHVGNGGKDAQLNQLLDHLGGALLHAACQLAHSNFVGNGDLGLCFPRDFQLQFLHPVPLLLLALVGGVALTLTVLVAADFLLAPAHTVCLIAGHIVVFLVELINIGGTGCTAGIHNAFLGHFLGNMGFFRLFVFLRGRSRFGFGFLGGFFFLFFHRLFLRRGTRCGLLRFLLFLFRFRGGFV